MAEAGEQPAAAGSMAGALLEDGQLAWWLWEAVVVAVLCRRGRRVEAAASEGGLVAYSRSMVISPSMQDDCRTTVVHTKKAFQWLGSLGLWIAGFIGYNSFPPPFL